MMVDEELISFNPSLKKIYSIYIDANFQAGVKINADSNANLDEDTEIGTEFDCIRSSQLQVKILIIYPFTLVKFMT